MVDASCRFFMMLASWSGVESPGFGGSEIRLVDAVGEGRAMTEEEQRKFVLVVIHRLGDWMVSIDMREKCNGGFSWQLPEPGEV